MKIDRTKQIQAILEFRFFDGTGPLVVTRTEIEKHVQENGLPKSSPKSGEIGYEYSNGEWVVSYYERNIHVGSKNYKSESEALGVIVDYALPAYKRNNA